jgi:hypothetical protein
MDWEYWGLGYIFPCKFYVEITEIKEKASVQYEVFRVMTVIW